MELDAPYLVPTIVATPFAYVYHMHTIHILCTYTIFIVNKILLVIKKMKREIKRSQYWP